MGWGEFDCRQPSCSCLGFSSWHVLRRPTVMGMWECWGGDQIHPKKWWQRLHVPLLLTNFMSFFCAKFKLLMSSNGLKNINMCMDESWVMRNFDVSLGSHCESRLDLINKRCTSGGNIDCFWMNFVRPFWDISQTFQHQQKKMESSWSFCHWSTSWVELCCHAKSCRCTWRWRRHFFGFIAHPNMPAKALSSVSSG